MPDEATPLTPEEIVDLREYVTHRAATYRKNVKRDGEAIRENFARCLATIDVLIAERDDLKGKAERRRVIFDEALQHLKTEPVHLVLFESNVRLGEQLSDAREILARIEHMNAGVSGPVPYLIAQLRTVLG